MHAISNVDRYELKYAETAYFFRKIAFEIDEDPDKIINYRQHKVIREIVNKEFASSLDRVKFYEAASYGDAGAFLASPGASLAGLMIKELATQEQSEQFFGYVKTTNARTFLAVTEPACGSNISQLTSRIKSKFSHYQLTAEKWLVGHGATGEVGVLLGKQAEGPLGVCAVLITPELLTEHKNSADSYIKRMTLPMNGLRGARLGRLIFKNISLQQEHILGSQLTAIARGMRALIKTFNCMRPCVGALAVGTAQAMIDYIYHIKVKLNGDQQKNLAELNIQVDLARKFLAAAAIQFDKKPLEGELSSLAKMKASQVAEKTAEFVRSVLSHSLLFEHLFIEKWYRDIFGFEYMEGTQNIQKITVFNAYQKKYV